MDPINMYEQVKKRQKALRGEAELDRLLAQAGGTHPNLIAHLLERMGDLMIKLGDHLRQQPASQGIRTNRSAHETSG